MTIAPLAITPITAGFYTTDTSTGTGSTGTTTGSMYGAVNPAAGNANLDRQAFLKLLVAQLKYQDPSKPMDASEMISQSAQLSMVDKLNEISTALTASSTLTQMQFGSSLIGKNITFSTGSASDGSAQMLTREVKSVKVASDGSLIVVTPDYDVPVKSIVAIGAVTTTTATTDSTATTPSTTATSTPAATTPAASTPATSTPATTTPATTTPAASTPASTPAADTATTTPSTDTPATAPSATADAGTIFGGP